MRLARWQGAVVSAALAAAAGAALAQTAPPARPTLAERLVLCGACHGNGGPAATPLTPLLGGQPRLFLENQLVIIREGLRDVPAMGALMKDIGDEEIGELAKHYAAQPARRPAPPSQPARSQAGAEIAKRLLCGTCHLPTYAGQQQVPRLAGQDEGYLVHSMKQFRDKPGPGRDTIMAATLRGLSDDELASLAHHLAHFAP